MVNAVAAAVVEVMAAASVVQFLIVGSDACLMATWSSAAQLPFMFLV